MSISTLTEIKWYDDAFIGCLTQNGLRKKEYNKTKHLYHRMLNKCRFLGDRKFSEKVKRDIRILLTRDIGRQLLTKIVNDRALRVIKIQKNREESYAHKVNREGIINLALNRKWHPLNFNESGEIIRGELSPSFLTLAHELIHLKNHKTSTDYSKLPPTLNLQYHNLEEQRTITGVGKGQEFDPINENAIRRAYGFLERINHLGMPVKPAEFENEEERYKYLCRLVRTGLKTELLEFLKSENLDLNRHIQFTNSIRTPFEVAALSNQVEIMCTLINHGAVVSYRSEKGRHALHSAAAYGAIDSIRWLIRSAKIDVNDRDADGNTPLHYVTNPKLSNGIKWWTLPKEKNPYDVLVQFNANPNLKNAEGHTAKKN